MLRFTFAIVATTSTPCTLGIAISHSEADAAATLRGSQATKAVASRQDPPGGAIEGWGHPTWGGRTFVDSPVAVNPWNGWTAGAESILGTLNPAAPMDRLDEGSAGASLTGAEPLAPDAVQWGPKKNHASREVQMQPDWLPPNHNAPPFPADHPVPVHIEDNPLIDMKGRQMFARPDVLRKQSKGFLSDFTKGLAGEDNSANYPLVAPAEEMPQGPWPVAPGDVIGNKVAGYLAESHERELELRNFRADKQSFRNTDLNRDGVISPEEFKSEVEDRQGKTGDEMRALWDEYHTSPLETMTEPEFGRLARTGFNIGAIKRNITSVISPGQHQSSFNDQGAQELAVDRGFWGSGASCPGNSFVIGAALKRMAYGTATNHDNSGLNAIRLVCEDGTVINSAEGRDGDWSAVMNCPPGQILFGVRIRMQAFKIGIDNSGVNDLQFMCKVKPAPTPPPPLGPYAEVGTPQYNHGGDGFIRSVMGSGSLGANGMDAAKYYGGVGRKEANVIVDDKFASVLPASHLVFPNGPIEGGWMTDTGCSTFSGICGAQVRLRIDMDEGDDIGVTDLRVYCCDLMEGAAPAAAPPAAR